MSFSFHTPLWIVLPGIVCAAAVSFFLYRFTVPRVSGTKRFILAALRTLALSCIIIALFESQLALTSRTTTLPPLAMLVDNSLSMTQTDRGKSREEILRRIVSGSSFAELSKRTDLKLFQFSRSLSPLVPDSLKANGGSTNISFAIEEAQRIIPARLRGILLVTDGNYTAGINPLYAAEKLPFPMFTVGVGDTAEQKDLLLSKISSNAVGYAGTSLPVDVVVKSTGMPSVLVSVSLFEDAKKIGEQSLRIAPNGPGAAEYPVRFQYTPSTPGIKKLTARVSPVKGEYTDKNNVRFSTIKILKSKMTVVVIAGAPHPDVSAIVQSLNRDKNIQTVLFTQFPNGEFHSLQTALPVLQLLSTADCLIFDGFPAAQTPPAFIQSITAAVSARSLSTLFIAGRSMDLQKLKLLQPILPFTVNAEAMSEQTVLPVVSSEYRLNTLVRPDAGMFPLFSWEKLPPVYAPLSVFAEKPESKKLLTAKVQGIPLRTPLFVSSQKGKIKSLAFLGYGLFRWQLLAGSANDTRGFFPAWMSSLVRWLAAQDDDKLFRVTPSQEIFASGEPVDFSGEVYNETFDPVDNADIQLSIRSSTGDEAAHINFSSAGSGRYTGTAPELAQGDYVFSSTAMIGGDTLARTEGRFSVGEQSVEFTETRMNKPLLQQMAGASSGIYADAVNFDSLVQVLLARPEMQSVGEIHSSDFQLWNLPAWLSAIILFFGIEWVIRKRSGML